MIHSPEYFEDLIAELQTLHPNMEIRYNPAIDVLVEIQRDIGVDKSPFVDISDVYADPIHLNQVGRYLMHNLMRVTIGLPNSSREFADVPLNVRSYLDSKIVSIADISHHELRAGKVTTAIGLYNRIIFGTFVVFILVQITRFCNTFCCLNVWGKIYAANFYIL